ncbi:MAG: hypothetical protein ACFFDQ_12750 [Candidatus Thorarchaeota archaeon]
MADIQVQCPRCNNTAKLEYNDKEPRLLKKVKGADWKPLLQKIGNNEWDNDWRNGVAILCKCKTPYFVYNQQEVTTDLKEDYSAALFCENCGSSFFSTTFECPRCQKRIA